MLVFAKNKSATYTMTTSANIENTPDSSLGKRKKKRPLWKRMLIRTGLTLAALVTLVAIAIGIALYVVFTPTRITPLVLKYANEYLDAKVECESVELTFFSTFPNLGVVLKNGTITKPLTVVDSFVQEGLPQDTLIAFRRCRISFNPVAFLSEKKVIVQKLRLNSPRVYAYMSPEGKANWDIFLQQSDTTSTAVASTDTSAFELPELNVKGVRISNASIIYDDRVRDIFASADSLHFTLDGNMSKDSARLDLALGIKALTMFYEGRALSKQLPLQVEARLHNNRTARRLTVEKASIATGILGFEAKGTLQGDSTAHRAMVDMELALSASSLADLLRNVPEQMRYIADNLKAEGELNLQGRFHGYWGQGNIPLLTASLSLKDGALRSANHSNSEGFRKIEVEGDAQIDFTGKTASNVHIGNILLQTASSTVKCSGKYNNIFSKPFIDASVEANIDFTRMAQDLTLPNGIRAGGTIQLNLSGKCLLNDLLAGNFGKIDASGTADIDKLTFKFPMASIDLLASSLKLRLGSNTKDSIRGREVESLLRGNVELDSLHLKYGNELYANAGKLSASFRTSEPKDSNTIAVLATTVRTENLNLKTKDSLRLRAIKTRASLRLTPSSEDKSKPELSARVTLDSLRVRMPEMSGRVTNAAFNMKLKRRIARSDNRATTDSTTRVQRMAARAASQSDSTMRAFRRDSLRRNDASYMMFRLESDDTRKMLRELDVTGTFECKNMSLRTPAFPLPIRMTESSLSFTTNTLLLTRTRLKVGASDMVLNGEVEGIRNALLRNGRLTAKVSVESDMADFNQLIRAFALGVEYAEKGTAQRDSIAQVVLDDKKALTAAPDTGKIGIFVIPRNIDLELDTKMKQVAYSNLLLNNVSGKIIIRNQSVQLSGLRMSSEVGSVGMSLVYKAPNTKGANLGMDLRMHNIHVKELLSAFPMIDTLAPMLRSFEGVVDCDMTAVSKLDSQSNVILPETTASCYLKGENMVLMDGETFSKIAKTLMFKNKQRNLIDSISVEMVLENSKALIFPFKVSVDRYVAGVGGTQNLDMSFDYHISVLKSPIPFKLGLNITGTPEKMKFRLARAKYKDLFSPAKEKSLANTQINLRKQMEEGLQKTIAEIMSEPLNATVRRPRITLNDSLRREYFQLDTAKVEVPEGMELQSINEH